LKRVADQAKNICDQTVFAVRGIAKLPKVYRILFIDRPGSGMGQLATAIGRKNFPDTAEFTSATPGGSDAVSDSLREFLQETGLPDEDLDSERLEALEHDFSDYIVIVCLNGQVSDHIQKVPFHSSALNWALPDGEGLAGQYRHLRSQITELVTLLAGEETTQA
jgi:protein-tyrosine-phosphatase